MASTKGIEQEASETSVAQQGREEAATSRGQRERFVTQFGVGERWNTIVYEGMIDGHLVRHEARVEQTPVPRSRIQHGQLVVEHSSGSYAIYEDDVAGEYIACPITP